MIPEVKKKMREILRLLIKANILEQNPAIDRYYCSFSYSPIKKKCIKCGQEIE